MSATWKSKILNLLVTSPGSTDREITDRLAGPNRGQQTVNQMCHQLESEGRLIRRTRHDGKIGNYLPTGGRPASVTSSNTPGGPAAVGLTQLESQPVARVPLPTDGGFPNSMAADGWLSEDDVKLHLGAWLENQGWMVEIAWGQERGPDIKAERGAERWVIEAKGGGSRPEMRVNYFLAILGETLQRMNDPCARYSIALPDMRQFGWLWTRLPTLAKSRLGITALFVRQDGTVEELGE